MRWFFGTQRISVFTQPYTQILEISYRGNVITYYAQQRHRAVFASLRYSFCVRSDILVLGE